MGKVKLNDNEKFQLAKKVVDDFMHGGIYLFDFAIVISTIIHKDEVDLNDLGWGSRELEEIRANRYESHTNKLERMLLKQSVRLHAAQQQAGYGAHNGSFRECEEPNCKAHRQALLESDVWISLQRFFEGRQDGKIITTGGSDES